MLDRAQARRLAAVLGLLGSDHVGERAAAGLLASRLLSGAGLSWADLLAGAVAPDRPSAAPGRAERPVEPPALARWVLDHGTGLSERESAFLAAMAGWGGSVSERQRGWLDALADRVEVQG